MLFAAAALTSLGNPAAPPAPPKGQLIAPTLECLVRFSDVIAIGFVDRIEHVRRTPRPPDPVAERYRRRLEQDPDDVKIAEVRITSRLKGPEGLDTVVYVATPNPDFGCGAQGATLGERGIYFLSDGPGYASADKAVRRGASDLFPGVPWMDLEAAGLGRLLLDEDERVNVRSVILPNGTDQKGAPTARSTFDNPPVPLARMIDLIRSDLSDQLRPWLRAAVLDASEGGVPWELEIRRNRESRLLVHAKSGDRERSFVANSGIVRTIQYQIDAMGKFPPPDSIGSFPARLGERRLEILEPDPARTIQILTLDEELIDRPGPSAGKSLTITAWKELRSLFDDAACADHRAIDARWR